MTGILLGSAIGVAATAFVLAPLLRRDPVPSAGALEPHEDEIRDLETERRMALQALRDLEDDRATGKMGESDYRELRAKLVARGARILERIDALSAPPPRAPGA